jgi:uncharacterized protein
MKKSDVLNLVNLHQEEIRKLGVKSLNLFGSVARDRATPQSDIDILVELNECVGFFEFFQIKLVLVEILDFRRFMSNETVTALLAS